ncbi:glycosyltransferase family 2 protein [Winogradskyella psychrotolerans]|uniref:glycosyltransferase family 2 protein n=1 Tax=Winogradskyella psychrotolerans TaxID=1344585 RepID=UPI001C06C161|nr:glycosyltransferase family 2 protein [Winogradskyella psychrotolerans]MBU2927348.1 glycosyltransferase [Winogradskyella psychrotolerans]
MTFFSVIISVYNKEKHIQSTIESVLHQTFKDFEIIVINDGSTDNSEKIINAFNDERITLITTPNQGASNARNSGIKAAKSDYIALLDGDDTWDSSYLQHMYDAIQKFPNSKLFSTGLAQKYKDKITPVNYSFIQTETHGLHNYFEASKKYTLITSSSVVFNTSILEKTGVFDTEIATGEDTDLWIRFGLHFSVLFINKPLACYNYDDYSLSNTNFDMDKKPKFNQYIEQEKDNSDLKIFLDRNRYSMAILSILKNDKKHYKFYVSNLDATNLSLRQRFLLKSPKWLLLLLLQLQSLRGEWLIYPKS